MAKHTPGPWIAIPSRIRLTPFGTRPPIHKDGRWVILPEYDVERLPIAEVDKGDDMHAPTRARAEWDACLIAAAPDLAEACQALVDVVREFLPDAELDPHDNPLQTTLAQGEAALSKARGEEDR